VVSTPAGSAAAISCPRFLLPTSSLRTNWGGLKAGEEHAAEEELKAGEELEAEEEHAPMKKATGAR
jgi:hypothetical protein